jgi:hypothetical protein
MTRMDTDRGNSKRNQPQRTQRAAEKDEKKLRNRLGIASRDCLRVAGVERSEPPGSRPRPGGSLRSTPATQAQRAAEKNRRNSISIYQFFSAASAVNHSLFDFFSSLCPSVSSVDNSVFRFRSPRHSRITRPEFSSFHRWRSARSLALRRLFPGATGPFPACLFPGFS